MKKYLFSGLMIFCFLLSYSQEKKYKGEIQHFQIRIHGLPNAISDGPPSFLVKGTCQFFYDGLSVKCKVQIQPYVMASGYDGSGAYKYKGNLYTGAQLSQYDNLGLQGFDVKIKSLTMHIPVVNGQKTGAKVTLDMYNNSFNDDVIVGDYPSTVDVTSMRLNEASFELKHVGCDNDAFIRKRIADYLKKQENSAKYEKIVSDADAAFDRKDYSKAKYLYEQALQISSSEPHPKNRLKDIAALEEKNKADKTNPKQNGSGSVAGATSGSGYSTSGETPDSGTNSSSGNVASGNTGNNSTSKWSSTPGYNTADNSGGTSGGGDYTTQNSSTWTKQQTDEYWTKSQAGRIAQENKIAEQSAKIQKNLENIAQSFYLANQIEDARAGISKAGKLSGNYNSLEELEADFSQKMQDINNNVQQMKSANSEQLMNNLNYISTQTSSKGQAAGAVITGITYLANEAQAKREKEAAEAKLEQQRRQAEMELEKKRMAMVKEMRSACLEKFPEGGIPSMSKTSDELYFFVYSYQPDELLVRNTVVQITNVFPVTQYGDGYWPLKSSLMHEISKKIKGNKTTLVGYFSSRDEAEQTRASFMRVAQKSEFITQDVNYEGKPSATSKAALVDYWGNPIK